MRDILNLHLVRDRLNTERIRQGNLHTVNEIIFNFILSTTTEYSEQVKNMNSTHTELMQTKLKYGFSSFIISSSLMTS